ncbi:unnamed protein product, partial [Ixodes hexagonus]
KKKPNQLRTSENEDNPKKKSNQPEASKTQDNPSIKEDVKQGTASKMTFKRKARSKPVKIEYSEGALKGEHAGGASPYFAWKPDNWEQVLSNIRQMRQGKDAPVDTMGCDKCPDQTLPEKLLRYQLLVSLMLSSQTKDEVTYAAVCRLREFGLTPEAVSSAEEKQLEEIIYPVSFYKNKAKHLKRTSQVLLEEYDGDIPDSIEGLCKLPGVGPKMGHLAMSCGWGRTVGIAVDTHVHRISNWLGWVPQPTKTPEQTRKALEGWLPRDVWDDVNLLLVGFGQTVCKPVNPKCSSCLNLQLCPYGRKQVKPKKEAT